MSYRRQTGHLSGLLLFAGWFGLAAQELTPDHLHTLGSARLDGGILRLTPAVNDQAGAAWLGEKQAVLNGFETTFRFQLTEQGGLGRGADGFAFVLQNAGPDALAGRGSSGGWALGDGMGDAKRPGIPLSIAIFFDTFKNGEIKDPSDNFITVSTNGKIGEMRWPPSRLAHTRRLKVRLKDRQVHTSRIVYRPPVMSVELDGAPVLNAAVDLRFVTDPEGASWVGFTASTGAGWENHDILSWTFSSPRPDVFVQHGPRFVDHLFPERAVSAGQEPLHPGAGDRGADRSGNLARGAARPSRMEREHPDTRGAAGRGQQRAGNGVLGSGAAWGGGLRGAGGRAGDERKKRPDLVLGKGPVRPFSRTTKVTSSSTSR